MIINHLLTKDNLSPYNIMIYKLVKICVQKAGSSFFFKFIQINMNNYKYKRSEMVLEVSEARSCP